MRLRSVRIFGFKTFADKTEFTLEGGVIAVVGPNGCGKSNLVDAILWGLGEGNSRQLRAASGQDVIFNGSARRKGVGFAEVTLLFDNEDGSLPIDSPEVSITRRLTRSGDSEYSINRRPCRQRDVFELLADSGLGRAGYAIVGQKEIDNALNASVEDRRAWIDEAAGVQRYRQRKVESLRRLASAQEHLQRVNDILFELESQREPLKQEAEQAARYKSVQSTLQEVEVGYLVNEADVARKELDALGERIEQSLRLAREEANKADSIDAEIAKQGAEISRIEAVADETRAVRQESLTAGERAQAEIRLRQQRLETLDEQEQSLSLDRSELQARVVEADVELGEAAGEETAESQALEELRTTMAGVGAESQQLTADLKSVERELGEAREREARRLKLQAERTHREERVRLAKRELKGVQDSIPDLEGALQEAQKSLDEQLGGLAKAEEAIKSVAAATADIRRNEDEEAKQVRSALAERASLEGRRRGIEATIDAHEGLSQGSRAVMEAADRGVLPGKYMPVGQAIYASKELAIAVETALGAAANDLIVHYESDAKTAIAWLKEHRAGRATFQPIPLMRVSVVGSDLRNLLTRPGVVGLASELVRCDPEYKPVIDSLLGRVVVVSNLDVSLGLAKTSGWARMVTLEGEVVHSSGAVTGGHQARQGYGLVQRKADLDEIDRELARASKLVGGFEKASQARTQEILAAEAKLPDLSRNRIAAEQEVTDARNYHRTIFDELKSAQREKEKLERELAQPLPEELGQAENLDQLQTRRDTALKLLASKSADVEQAESRLREAETRIAQARSRRESAQKRLDGARAAEQTRERRAENIEPERKKAGEEIVKAREALAKAMDDRRKTEETLEALQVEKRSLLEESLRLTEEAKHIRDNVSAVGAAAHQAELNRTRADARRSTALVRLAEEYGLAQEEVDEQVGRYEPPADAPAIVQRLRRELRAMGDVNLGAMEAYERLTVRFSELEAQHDDVKGGIDEVEGSIRELDKLTKDRFATTFEQVQIAFAEMFTKLFGGGEGSIALTDPGDILNSGIDIEVTLPGKKRQPLTLLSGGERALCTSAFLFALLRVKPSPLVVLDEVDAPLDGRNVERFAATLHEFSERSQFIVITHNENTIAATQSWLGVTMQEPGVSTLLPARAPSPSRSAESSEDSAPLVESAYQPDPV